MSRVLAYNYPYMSEFDSWCQTPLGRQLRTAESAVLSQHLQSLFGYHLLMTGSGDRQLLEACRVSHCVVLHDLNVPSKAPGSVLQGCPEHLPIQSDSLDVLVLAHTLEFSNDPHQVLREAERVLIPEGHLIVLGINPRSLWGVNRWVRLVRREIPWCGKFRSLSCIKDWTSLLGFEWLRCDLGYYRPPLQHQGLLNKLAFLEKLGKTVWPFWGGFYIVTVRKKVTALTPIRPRWRTRPVAASSWVDSASRREF